MTRRFDIVLPDEALPVHDPWCWRDDWRVEGESAFALLAKFQRLNALSCAALTDSFASRGGRRTPPRDLDLRDARRFDLPRMMELLRLSLADVAAAFVMPFCLNDRIASPTLRWCVRCAQAGVHLTAFQDLNVDECPVHHLPLEQRCERCGEAIPYRLRPDIFRTPFNCPSCARPWWVPTQGPDDLRVARPFQRRVAGRVSDTLARARESAAPDEAWIAFGASATAEGEDPWNVVSACDGSPGDIDARARACYKCVRRRLMRVYAQGHHTCITTAARHLVWPLAACATTPFCPVAHAFLRWRCKWEGVSTPGCLLQRPAHGALGLAIWLSIDAPVAPASWSRAASQWLTLHLLVQACMDSFRTFLSEAQDASEHRRPLWLPFPARDFARRTVVVRGGVYRKEAAQIQILALPKLHRDFRLYKIPGNNAHRSSHQLRLYQNVRPVQDQQSKTLLSREN
ncbi:hypothetical protein [Paraburkholderia youngii]|uniref:TniQ protein n=1 Tax=Paraburkholderia youngii TaxID=2782701 RepID=A0A7Y6K907_9BURK|nr:hypothetical protein [Paraburkholderia youngii]NUY06141.1 hypothetical protein [Paraburkholderia youngii]